MRAMLSQIDLVVECRDYRTPLTSRNPMFEDSLAGQERLIVYTKKDLGTEGKADDQKVGIAVNCSLSCDGMLMVSRDTRFSLLSTILLLFYSRITSRAKTFVRSWHIFASLVFGMEA